MGSIHSEKIARQKFKKKLERWGMDPKEIELCLEQVTRNQRAKKRGEMDLEAPLCTRAEYIRLLKINVSENYDGAAALKIGDDYIAPSDKGYAPTRVDSVLTGAARATGITAKAVKRGKTLTKFEHDNQNA